MFEDLLRGWSWGFGDDELFREVEHVIVGPVTFDRFSRDGPPMFDLEELEVEVGPARDSVVEHELEQSQFVLSVFHISMVLSEASTRSSRLRRVLTSLCSFCLSRERARFEIREL